MLPDPRPGDAHRVSGVAVESGSRVLAQPAQPQLTGQQPERQPGQAAVFRGQQAQFPPQRLSPLGGGKGLPPTSTVDELHPLVVGRDGDQVPHRPSRHERQVCREYEHRPGRRLQHPGREPRHRPTTRRLLAHPVHRSHRRAARAHHDRAPRGLARAEHPVEHSERPPTWSPPSRRAAPPASTTASYVTRPPVMPRVWPPPPHAPQKPPNPPRPLPTSRPPPHARAPAFPATRPPSHPLPSPHLQPAHVRRPHLPPPHPPPPGPERPTAAPEPHHKPAPLTHGPPAPPHHHPTARAPLTPTRRC